MITPEAVVTYTQCKLKAYFLLCTDKQGITHEYISILEEETKKNREEYFSKIKKEIPESKIYSSDNIKAGIPTLLDADLIFDDLGAHADALTRVKETSTQRIHNYTPTLVVGTYKISKEQKIQLAFIAYVLSKFQKKKPAFGTIVVVGNSIHKVKLETLYKESEVILESLKIWSKNSNMEPPPIILNKHCMHCPFQKDCETKSIQKDDLSLLSRMSLKDIQKYHKKGVFTTAQLSYLFRPRTQRKGKKKTKSTLRFRPELQALAIRTEKIYIQELPMISRHSVEIFLDIEGVPDQDSYYLIGLLIICGNERLSYSFWSDSKVGEQQIWDSFIEKVNEYPNAPIYHYGGYDSKAIHQLNNRYGKDSKAVEERLINVSSFIYGKIYFPVRSNSLKELGKFLGMTWSHPKSSGLQSLVWRHHWIERKNKQYKQILITYNQEDCNALYLLTEELSKIVVDSDSKWNIDFADQPKKYASNIGSEIHEKLGDILKFAHADYDKNKISMAPIGDYKGIKKKKRGGQKGHQGFKRIIRSKAGTIIQVKSRRGKCPRHKSNSGYLRKSDIIAEKTIIDLHFSKNGCRKKIIKYVGNKVFCNKCHAYFLPPIIAKFNNRLFGHSFQAWVIYQRIFLRMPYETIIQVLQDTFGESISPATIPSFVRSFKCYYYSTESALIQRMLESPFIHADETKINIQGEDQYVWVFTDGKHVVLRKTETREASIIHEFLFNYTGVLISDFYPGYDSVKCRQQKCWVHLIRDINDDLWREPFNEEFELFILEVKRLIIPIFQTIQKYGAKKRHFNKFRKPIDQFYKKNIDHKCYNFEITSKYQKRFQRYRDSLFVFLEEDGIPWNNNMAERAIRHLAVQRKISGTFYDSLVSEYLLLLGIAQSCRFQDKPFLKFLLSQEKDVDLFKAPKPLRYSQCASKHTVAT